MSQKLPDPPTINGVPMGAGPGHEFHVHEGGGLIHVNAPNPSEISIKRIDCPTCKKSRFMVVYFEDWYGATTTCLKCGEQWSDGEMRPRPFARGWRKDSVTRIKVFYRRIRERIKATKAAEFIT